MTTDRANEDRQLVADTVARFVAGVRERPGPVDEIWGRQYDAGLAWVEFPAGLGGLGVSRSLRPLVTEALREAGVPDSASVNGLGVSLAAPVLISHGSPEQQRRHLRTAFTGAEIWCQLFSEPGAGSDLAALATRAEADGTGGWRVNGQKVWTTLAHVSDWGLLCARTDPDAPKHVGLTMFAVDMRAPGVDVRPIREITGDADFNEVFLSDVHLPQDAIIGAPGAGWSAIIGTLANERAGFSPELPGRGDGPIGQAAALWAEHGRSHPELTDRYLRLWVRAEAVRLAERDASRSEATGTPSTAWSYLKTARSELDQEIYDLCVTLLGTDGLEYPSYEMRRPSSMAEVGPGDDVRHAYLFSRCSTIAGGTSEIQRTVVADRILGLPREPQTDRDLSWRLLRRS